MDVPACVNAGSWLLYSKTFFPLTSTVTIKFTVSGRPPEMFDLRVMIEFGLRVSRERGGFLAFDQIPDACAPPRMA